MVFMMKPSIHPKKASLEIRLTSRESGSKRFRLLGFLIVGFVGGGNPESKERG
jgi:hypothetical protein